jgi:hypothetical protein
MDGNRSKTASVKSFPLKDESWIRERPRVIDAGGDFKLLSPKSKPFTPIMLVVDPAPKARVACGKNRRAFGDSLSGHRCLGTEGFGLEIDDEAKEIVRDIGTAINESVENSPRVAEAIERLRDAGYEMELTLRLEIGLRPHSGDDDSDGETSLELTDEDVQVLQRMKIRIDPEEKL